MSEPGAWHRISRKAFIALVLPLVIVSTSCSGDDGSDGDTAGNPPATDGPMIAGDGSGSLCVPTPSNGQDLTIGTETLRNTGSDEVVVRKVALVNPRGVSIAEASIAPIVDHTLVGAWSSWPPRDPARGWENKSEADGYRVLPDEDEENVVNLLLRIKMDSPASDESGDGGEVGFEKIEVEYSVDGTDYVARTTTAVVVASPCE